MDANAARQRSRTYDELARAFSKPEPGLEREFTRLFLGPGRPVAHPYESVYREGRTMGNTTLDVRRRLADEGLAPRDRTLPDHVGIELAFMAHMASREALAWDDGDSETARDCLSRQGSFLHDHLVAWLPQFCHRVLVGRPHAHYADVARRTEAFVVGDAARVRVWLGDGVGAKPVIVTDQGWWDASVRQGCTLCDICVQVCRTGALKRVRHTERRELVLQFESALCDGCAACQRWCPEMVISVDRILGGEPPPDSELACSAMLACPRCGQFHAPTAMVTKVQAQVGTANEALLQRLALCHGCKATRVPLRRANPTAAHHGESIA